jgi:hypothetical protein
MTIVGITIGVSGLSASVRLVIFPLSLIAVAISIYVLPKTVGDIVSHIAFIVAAIHSDVTTAPTATALNKFSFKVLTVVEFECAETMRNIAVTFANIVCF